MPGPAPILRDGLLDGLTLLAAPRTPATDACAALGARVEALEADLLDEAATLAAVEGSAATMLVVDTAPLFGAGGEVALRAALDGAWSAVHAHFDPERTEKIVLVAPPPGAGEHAGALRAGLENAARTLSIEWARHQVRIVAILPGDATDPADLAQLVAYLASPAGDYFSGCALTLA